MGRKESGAPTTAAGVAAVTAEMEELGLARPGTQAADGSGLDESNKASCRLLMNILDQGGPDGLIADGLAVAGKTGTLAGRFLDSPARERLRAKTGTLNTVTALTGFVHATQGPVLTFAYIANGEYVNPELLGLQEDLGGDLVVYPNWTAADRRSVRSEDADVPARDGAVPRADPAAARLRAALPRHGAGLPRGRPAVRRGPHRAGERGGWPGRPHRRRHDGPHPRERGAAGRPLGARHRRGRAASRSSGGCPTTRTRGRRPRRGPTTRPTATSPTPTQRATALLRRALGLQAELGEATVPSTVPIAEDPASGSFHVAALAPIGPLDQQRLLAAPGPRVASSWPSSCSPTRCDVLTQRLAMG